MESPSTRREGLGEYRGSSKRAQDLFRHPLEMCMWILAFSTMSHPKQILTMEYKVDIGFESTLGDQGSPGIGGYISEEVVDAYAWLMLDKAPC
jgi:hypothetical protein